MYVYLYVHSFDDCDISLPMLLFPLDVQYV